MVNSNHFVEILLLLGSFSASTLAFWRLPCRGRAGLGRIDPLVDPGTIAAHAHTIHGGNNFGFSTTSADLLVSNCTSCAVKQDKSAYWTPPIYFQHANGTTEIVPQIGGMLAYYLLYTESSAQQIQAFPNGFQMVAGDTNRRNFTCAVPEPPKSLWTGFEITQPALRQKALGFNCLNYNDVSKTEPSLMRHYLPDKSFMDQNCLDGIRTELMFPSCWNGKDLDTPDHKSHMAYPELVMTGNCPSDFSTRTPSLFYETIWDTYSFKNYTGQFLLSNGDPTGYGYHGDFMAAWDAGFLQKAVDQCTNASGRVEDCAIFDLQSDSDAQQCTFQPPAVLANDNPQGPRQGLPGNVPVQVGPQAATPLSPGVSAQSTDLAATSSYLSLLVSSTAQTLVPTSQVILSASSATDKNGGGIVVAAAVSTTQATSSVKVVATTSSSLPIPVSSIAGVSTAQTKSSVAVVAASSSSSSILVSSAVGVSTKTSVEKIVTTLSSLSVSVSSIADVSTQQAKTSVQIALPPSSSLSLAVPSTSQSLVPTSQAFIAAPSAADTHGGGLAFAEGMPSMPTGPPKALVEVLAASHPETTAAPEMKMQVAAPNCYSTKYVTEGRQEWVVCVEEDVVTVTATAGPGEAVHRRRDLHRHGYGGIH